MMPRTEALHLVIEECDFAQREFSRPFASMHEGLAVLQEEVYELQIAVYTNRPDLAQKEAVQVAAMAIRLLTDCGLSTKQIFELAEPTASPELFNNLPQM